MVCSILASTSVLAVWVDGGQWNYGVGWSGNFGYSDYLHSTRYHTATVRHGGRTSKDYAKPEAWARASSPRFHQREWNISMDLSKILPSPIWRGKTVVEALL